MLGLGIVVVGDGWIEGLGASWFISLRLKEKEIIRDDGYWLEVIAFY